MAGFAFYVIQCNYTTNNSAYVRWHIPEYSDKIVKKRKFFKTQTSQKIPETPGWAGLEKYKAFA